MAETRVPRGINFAGSEGWDESFSSNTTLDTVRSGCTTLDMARVDQATILTAR